jgi:DNA processing protein
VTLDLSVKTARMHLEGVVPPSALEDDAVRDQYARAVWSHVAEPGDSVAGAIIRSVGAHAALVGVLEGASAMDLGGVAPEQLAPALKRWAPRMDGGGIGHGLELARSAGVRLLTPADPEWPRRVDDLGIHAPIGLWVRGDARLLARPGPAVALVGARAASAYGEHVAMELAADLAGSGIPVVSGAAYGIDGAAHRAALATGGPTIALLAGGVERPYPAGHASLLERVSRAGAVVSEVPCGSAPTKWRFLARNRLIAAMADATVVVEAGWRSGSLNTAAHAGELGRPLGAVPGAITSASSAGCHRLLREFGATCVTSAGDVRELLGVGHEAARAVDGRPRTDERTRVRDALSTRAWRDVRDVARRSGMAVDDVEAHLGVLLLEGGVDRDDRGWRLTARRGG